MATGQHSINTLIRFVERFAARWGHCHSLTPSLVKDLAENHRIGHPKRWHCLPIPIAPLSPSGLTRPELVDKYKLSGWSADIPTVGFLGRLVPVKDPIFFIDSLRKLSSAQKIQILIAGDGPLRQIVERHIQQLPPQFTAWSTGFIPASDAFAMMDLLVLSSRNEGTPSLIEAASLAVPVIAPRVGGIKDLVESHFLKTFERSEQALTHAMQTFLKGTSQNQDLIHQDAASFIRQFSPEQVVPRYFSVTKQIISD